MIFVWVKLEVVFNLECMIFFLLNMQVIEISIKKKKKFGDSIRILKINVIFINLNFTNRE